MKSEKENPNAALVKGYLITDAIIIVLMLVTLIYKYSDQILVALGVK